MTENIVHRLWHTTPPITRTIFILSIITSFLVYIDIISPFTLQFSLHYISKLQLWRLITCFFYFGKLNLETIFHIIFLCRYSKMLEESMSISDYTYLVSIIMLLLYTINYFVYLRLSHALSAVITYLWARKNPFSHIQYMGCIVLHAFYLPFIVPLYSLLSERSMPRDDFIGIFVGHLVFYFKYIWPKMGNDFLRTPVWIKKMFNDYVPEEANEPKVQEIIGENTKEKDTKGKDIKEKDVIGKEVLGKKDIVDSIDDGVDDGIDESSECIDNKSCTSSTLREFDYPKSEYSSSSHFSNVDEHFGDRHEEIDSDIMSCDSTSSFHEPEEEGFDDSSDVLEEKFKEKSEEFEDW